MELISVDQGLSQGSVFDIMQDSEGFLWFSTKDGLNRYDGHEFKSFTNDPNDPWSISSNQIPYLFEDSKGRIWAPSTNSGINIYDKITGRFHRIQHDLEDDTSLSGNYVSSIVEDSSGYFVVVIDEQEINMFRLQEDFFTEKQNPKVIRVSMPNETNTNQTNLSGKINGMVKDKKNRIWVGGFENLFQLNVKNAKLELIQEDITIQNTYSNEDGSIWTCFQKEEVFHWDGQKATVLFDKNIADGLGLQVDENENLWYLRSDTLFGFDLNYWQPNGEEKLRPFYTWHPETSVGAYPFKSISIDRSGLIWVGTNGVGVYKINPNHSKFSHNLAGTSIRQIVPIDDEETILLSYTTHWHNNKGKNLGTHPFSRSEMEVELDYMLVSKNGEIWLRQVTKEENKSKITRINPITKTEKDYYINWFFFDFQPMIEAQDGTIWLAGFDDIISQINPATDKITSYNLTNGHKVNNPIHTGNFLTSKKTSTALYQDANDILWVGSSSGFVKCILPENSDQNIQITKYDNIPGDQNSLSYSYVNSFLDDPIDPQKYLWIATKGGGINRLDKSSGNFVCLSKDDGLPDNVVYGLLADDEGNIWGSTNQGLFCMSQNNKIGDNQTEYVFRNFSRSDGLQENEFNTGAFTKMPDGRLAFGGVNGYSIFEPKDVLSEHFMPPIFITNIQVNNQPIVAGDESKILSNTIENTKGIILSHLDKILTLEFVSLDYTNPERNKYRYQLIGADDTWIEAGNRRSATFLNLRPGDYTFNVQGTNSQGIWSDHIAQLNIKVLPPWWLSWWACLLYSLLIGYFLWKYFDFVTKRSLLNQQLIFEKKEVEKVKELDHLKTRLYTNLTHEFRTPLTIIIGTVDLIKGSTEFNMSEGLDMIKRNGESLLQLINKMLDLSKIEGGKMVLDSRQGDIIQTLKNVSNSFVSFAANNGIELHFLSELDQCFMEYDDEKVRHVISNLISNAVKFTNAGGHIYVNIRREIGVISIRIKDTGKGIPLDEQSRIFDRFYQVESESNRSHEGTGIGLALCKELVLLMNGEITVQSPPSGASIGAEFVVNLPIAGFIANSKLKQEIPRLESQKKALLRGQTSSTPSLISLQKETLNHHIVQKEKSVILIVEDNTDIVSYLASCLQDFMLLFAANGAEGLEIAIDAIPDLIVSDVMMPIMDGFEMCNKIKQDARTNHIPVVILTAKADIESKIEGLEYGANAYIPKPFDKNELTLTIRNLFHLRTKLHSLYTDKTELNEPHGQSAGVLDTLTPKQDEFVEKVQDLIVSKIDDFNLSVEELAKELHYSQSQFSRKLNAVTGMTAVKFIRKIRIEKAMTLLLKPELSITEIAFNCGFNDPSYFSRVFKKELRESPVEWREKNLG